MAGVGQYGICGSKLYMPPFYVNVKFESTLFSEKEITNCFHLTNMQTIPADKMIFVILKK